MDRKTGKEILALFGQLNEEGRSIVMVTHDPEIAGYAGEVVVLQDGQIVDKISQKGGNEC
jgi:putative ABC transport system ATP-binding protein